jgi:hypothetical protein
MVFIVKSLTLQLSQNIRPVRLPFPTF